MVEFILPRLDDLCLLASLLTCSLVGHFALSSGPSVSLDTPPFDLSLSSLRGMYISIEGKRGKGRERGREWEKERASGQA